MRTTHLSCNGTSFPSLQSGPKDGAPVILLHGFPQTSRAWRTQVAALGDAGFNALAPDLRGFADTTVPVDPARCTLSEAAGDVLAIADELGAESFHLAGHDLGGIVAWELGCRVPARVRSLVVVSTPHLAPFADALLSADAERLPPFELFRQPGVAEGLMLADDAAVLRAAYAGLEDDAVEEYVARFSAPGVLAATLAYFRAFDFEEWRELPACPLPTLFIWGREDPFLASATASATREHVDGDYREAALAGIGHWVPELAADQVSELMLEHLRR